MSPLASTPRTARASRWRRRRTIGWLKVEGRERTTIEGYEGHLKHHILPRIGRLKLASLSTPRINAFRDELLASISVGTGEKTSRAMARKVLGSLKSLIRDAQRRGNVAQNVALGVSVQFNKRDRRKLRVGEDIPTPDEVRRMIEAAHGRQRALLVVASFTGLRSSELRGLRWSDIELEGAEPQVHVRQRADRYRTMGSLKSASAERTVPLGPFVANTLRSLRALDRHGELAFANSRGNAEYHQVLVQRCCGGRRSRRASSISTGARSIRGCTACGISTRAGASIGASMAGWSCRSRRCSRDAGMRRWR